jgi:hypothetical protein
MARRGPRTCYPNKRRPSESILLTDLGRGSLYARSRRYRVSRSDIVETLIRLFAAELTPEMFERLDEGDAR